MIPRSPDILRHLFPGIIFRLPEKVGEPSSVFLTFDDGPHPRETDFVLTCLKKFNASATFFVSGMQAEKYPDLIQRIRDEGHHIGNHGYSHLKAGKTDLNTYIEDVRKGESVSHSRLFRPPYGKLTPALYYRLRQFCRPVLWDIITEDYRQDIDADILLRKTLKQIRNGSLVVFHDQPKAWKNLEYMLPIALQTLQEKGLRMKSLADYEPFVE